MAAGSWTGWTDDIVLVLNAMNLSTGDEFTLARVYAFEPLLRKIHPNNNHIQAKIRQQLQVMQDHGAVEFLTNQGHYRLLKPLDEL